MNAGKRLRELSITHKLENGFHAQGQTAPGLLEAMRVGPGHNDGLPTSPLRKAADQPLRSAQVSYQPLLLGAVQQVLYRRPAPAQTATRRALPHALQTAGDAVQRDARFGPHQPRHHQHEVVAVDTLGRRIENVLTNQPHRGQPAHGADQGAIEHGEANGGGVVEAFQLVKLPALSGCGLFGDGLGALEFLLGALAVAQVTAQHP